MGRAWEVVRPQGSHCEVAAVTTAVMLELEQTHTHAGVRTSIFLMACPPSTNSFKLTKTKIISPTHQSFCLSHAMDNTFDLTLTINVSYKFDSFNKQVKCILFAPIFRSFQ